MSTHASKRIEFNQAIARASQEYQCKVQQAEIEYRQARRAAEDHYRDYVHSLTARPAVSDSQLGAKS